MFENRFVSLVKSGEKRHTIRRMRKGPQIEAGTELSLRHWNAKPYRSKQIEIGGTVCVKTSGFVLSETGAMVVGGVELDRTESERLAIVDGFNSIAEMVDWHRNAGQLGCELRLIEWRYPFNPPIL